jgi:VanZ family protein
MKLFQKTAYALPALIMAGAIFYVSSRETIDLPLSIISFSDLFLHTGAYFFFGITIWCAAYPWNTSPDYPLRTYMILGVIGILYGLSDEIHQSFVPNRACTASDFFADSVGVILALAAVRMCIKKKVHTAINRSTH